MTDLLRVRMWAMGIAMDLSADDTPRDAIEERAQWLVDWVMGDPGAAHEPELPESMKFKDKIELTDAMADRLRGAMAARLTRDEADF